MAKVMISIPDDELAVIDLRAAARGMSRSAFLRHCVASHQSDQDHDRITMTLERLRAIPDRSEGLSAEEMVRRDRDAGHGR